MPASKRNLDQDAISRVLEDARREVRYIVTDFSVELVVSKFKETPGEEGDIYIPDYQRILVWTNDQQSYFVESLLLKIPVPPIFFYDVDGMLEIVDGSQRIRSLVSFSNNTLKLSGLQKLDILNGLTISGIPVPFQRRFNNTPVRSFVLEQSTDEETRVDLFRRLNTSGKKLADAEIRKGVYKGRFLDLIIECAASAVFVSLSPKIGGQIDPVAERQELVTRFFVYALSYTDFTHDVRRFLDTHVASFNKTLNKTRIIELKALFIETMNFISSNFPKGFYRKGSEGRLPRVRFEAVSVGTALAIQKRPNLKFKDARWLGSKTFEDLVKGEATNSGPKLRARVEYVRDALLE